MTMLDSHSDLEGSGEALPEAARWEVQYSIVQSILN